MYKLEYWNVRLRKWLDLTEDRYIDEAAALGAKQRAVENGMRIDEVRVKFAAE